MKILVAGCKLQGTEIIYLGKKAGYHVTGVDRNPSVCGSSLTDEFVCTDFENKEIMLALFSENDIVIPAVEDEEICFLLKKYGEETDVPVVFDLNSYKISSSKKKSNELFNSLGLNIPEKFPDCGFPVIIKPDGLSGSHGVYRANNMEEYEEFISKSEVKPVVQQYLEGRSFSLEVLSFGEKVVFPMITEVLMDSEYDCSRIVAPAEVTDSESKQMFEIGSKLQEALDLDGIFDIEVISHNGILKLLEIDARVPSQTPVSVYQASGFNMIEWLCCQYCGEKYVQKITEYRVCWYQQINVTESSIDVLGERIMSSSPPLNHIYDFFGCDEALTSWTEYSSEFTAILIITGKDNAEVKDKFLTCCRKIQDRYGFKDVYDKYTGSNVQNKDLCQA